MLARRKVHLEEQEQDFENRVKKQAAKEAEFKAEMAKKKDAIEEREKKNDSERKTRLKTEQQARHKDAIEAIEAIKPLEQELLNSIPILRRVVIRV
jgi:hypothetical protein